MSATPMSARRSFAVSEFANVVLAGATEISGETLLAANLGYGLRLRSQHRRDASTRCCSTPAPKARSSSATAATSALDLGEVEEIAITHGHWDHMGALPAAIDAIVGRRGRGSVTVHVNPGMFNERGVLLKSGIDLSRRPGADAGPDGGARRQGRERRQRTRLLLDGHFYYSGEIPRVSAFETGRQDHLCRRDNSEEWRPDPYLMDERMLVANVRDLGLVVFSACSHAGIVNVCTEVRRLFPDSPIHAVMGGLHLGGVMEHLIPADGRGAAALRHPTSHHRPLHRLAGIARPGRRLWRAGQPVGGRHQLPVRQPARRRPPHEASRHLRGRIAPLPPTACR